MPCVKDLSRRELEGTLVFHGHLVLLSWGTPSGHSTAEWNTERDTTFHSGKENIVRDRRWGCLWESQPGYKPSGKGAPWIRKFLVLMYSFWRICAIHFYWVVSRLHCVVNLNSVKKKKIMYFESKNIMLAKEKKYSLLNGMDLLKIQSKMLKRRQTLVRK